MTATNGSGTSPAVSFSITINAGGGSAPVVSATPAPTAGTIGTAYNYQVTASNTPTGYAVSTGTLPAGLTLNTTSGLISGTPTAAGTSTFGVTATNGSGTSPAVSFSITINAGGGSAPVVSATPAPTAGTIGTAYNYQVVASNTPTGYAVSTGTLPAGLSLNTTNGLISGTPTAAGTSTFSVTATNGSGTSPAVSFSITIGAANTPVISTTTPTTGLQNGYYSYQLAASNNPTTYTVSIGTLPAGLVINANGTAGLIAGTPTSSGTFTVGIAATNTNGAGPVATMTFTITANTDTNLATNTGVTAISSSPTTDMSSAAQAIDGNFGSRWETQHGTAADPSTMTIDLQQSYTIDSIDIDWENASAATYTISVSQTGLAGSWTRVGPTDSFVNAGGGMNLWTGIGQTARFVQLTGLTRTTPYGYSIWEFQIFGHAGGGSAPVVSATPAPSAGTVGTAYTYQVTASNTSTGYAVSTGTLPAGLNLNATSGLISGTPTVAGTSTFSVTATNGSGTSPAVSFSITINAGGGNSPVVTTTTPWAGLQNAYYTYPLASTNGGNSYAVTTGALPAGLTIANNAITGTPTASGTFTFGIAATSTTNGTGPAASMTLTIGASTDANLALPYSNGTTTLTPTAVSSSPATDISSAAQAIDGNFGSRWETQHGTAADPSSITINLGQVNTIHALNIYWEDAAAMAYTIQTSTDGTRPSGRIPS